jgi:hypothetical protein
MSRVFNTDVNYNGNLAINSGSTSVVPLIIAPTGTLTVSGLSVTHTGGTPGTDIISGFSSVSGLYVGQYFTSTTSFVKSGIYTVGYGAGSQIKSIDSTNLAISVVGSGPFTPTGSYSGGTLVFLGTPQNLQEWRESNNTAVASVSNTGVLTASSFVGNGASLTSLNGANISSIPTSALSSVTGTGTVVVTDTAPTINGGMTVNGGITLASPITVSSGSSFTAFSAAASLTLHNSTFTGTANYSNGTTSSTAIKTINIGSGVISGTGTAGTSPNMTINIGTGNNTSTTGATAVNIMTGTISGGATGAVTIGSTSSGTTVTVVNPTNAPSVQSGTTYSLPATAPTPHLVLTNSSQVTLTLPTSVAGKEIRILCQGAGGVISASSNVYPKTSRTLGTAIITGAGSALLVGDGTNWQVMS